MTQCPQQMAELNPLIRNEIHTALYVSVTTETRASQSFISFTTQLIPPYWEQPQLIESYRRLVELYQEDKDTK